MTLDIDRYSVEVLRPLRLRPGALPSTIAARYGLFEPLTGEALDEHLDEVRRYWEVTGGGVGTLAEVCRRLAATDKAGSPDRLAPEDLEEPAPELEPTEPEPAPEFDLPPAPAPRPSPPSLPPPAPGPRPVSSPEPAPAPGPPPGPVAPPSSGPSPPQVTDARAEWFSDHLSVSWSWPDEVNWVRVTLVPGRRTSAQIVSALSAIERAEDRLPPEVETRNLSRSQYFAQGGCIVPWEGPPGVAQIRSLRRTPGGALLSEPVEVRLAPPRTVVRWEAVRPRRLMSRGRQRQWMISGQVEGDGVDLELAVAAQQGTVVPPRLEQRDIIVRHRIDGSLSDFVFLVDVPEDFGRRYTLRCFVIGDDRIEVVDPPFKSLKG